MPRNTQQNLGVTQEQLDRLGEPELAKRLLGMLDERIMGKKVAAAHRAWILKYTEPKMTKQRAQELMQATGAYNKDGSLKACYR